MVNDNWGFAVQEQLKARRSSPGTALCGVPGPNELGGLVRPEVIRDNSGVKEYGYLFTVTLKAFRNSVSIELRSFRRRSE